MKYLLGLLFLAACSTSPPWIEGKERTEKIFDKDKNKTVTRIHYPAGVFGNDKSGAQWVTYFDRSYNDLKISYWLRLSENFDCQRGGKLPGLIGGHQKGKIHSTLTGGHKPDGTDGWSARVMWRSDCRLVQYVYYKNQPDKYGEDFKWKKNGKEVILRPGKWHQLSTRVVMNQIGKRDGLIQSWFDGEIVLDQSGFEFRTVESISIDAFYFSTFFGGDDQTWAPTRDVFADFDQFVIE